MDGGATAGSSHDQPIAGPMDGGAASGGSSHDDNAHTESGAMNTGAAAGDSSVGTCIYVCITMFPTYLVKPNQNHEAISQIGLYIYVVLLVLLIYIYHG